MKKDSPAIHFIDHCWLHSNGRSWEQINHAMSAAVQLAVQAGMTFEPDDFTVIDSRYRPEYWLTRENIYTLAIFTENKSAIDSLEKYMERTAIIADEVSARIYQAYVMHGDSLNRDRERLFVGATFRYGDHMPKVTSFKNGSAIACTYKPAPAGGYGSGKIDKRFKVTRELVIADRKARKDSA